VGLNAVANNTGLSSSV